MDLANIAWYFFRLVFRPFFRLCLKNYCENENPRHNNTPRSLLLLVLLLLLIAVVVCLQAYEETISEWTTFRPTFARLSINVTAHFGVAPVNTTSPGLDPNPPPPGTPLALAVSEDADPIHDEEGDAGGLPNYVPLKLGEQRGREGGVPMF